MLSKKTQTKKEKTPILKQRSHSRFIMTTLLMTMLLGVFTQCKKDDFADEIKGVCPLVISTNPANKAVSVISTKKIDVTFNVKMDPTTIDTKSFTLMQESTAITGKVTPTSGETPTFTFTPDSPLAPFTVYTGTMKKGVRDPMRNALQEDYVWTFTTQPQVLISSSPKEGGTTTGAGIFNVDSLITVKAVPAIGYTFTNWTEGTVAVSTQANYAFKIIGNRVLVANFAAIPKYTVMISSNPQVGGTTTGSGAYESGTSVTAKAVPTIGYTFKNWTEGTTIVSTDADFTFILSANKTLVANFTAAVPQFTVALSSNPLLGGTTTGAGKFDSGTSVTAKAVPAVGYTFKNWTEGVNIVSTDANFVFTLTANRTLVANFTAITPQFTVALSSNPMLGGTTSGGGLFNSGTSVTVKAVPAVGYTFKNWTEGISIVSANADYNFTLTANRTLVANFTSVVIPPVGPGPIDLKSAADFSTLTKSGISSTGITSVEGNIGVSPAAATAITGFGLIMDTNGQSSHTTIATHVTGKVYASDYAPPTPSKLTVAVADMETAYTTANNLVTPAPIVNQGAGNLSGLTLAPGLYKWSTGVKINPGATVTLAGGPNDTWVFQIAQDLTLDPGAQVKLIGGAQAKNITWVVAGQAILNTNTVLYGNIMSKTLISLNTGAKVTGGLFAQTAVTLNTSIVVKP